MVKKNTFPKANPVDADMRSAKPSHTNFYSTNTNQVHFMKTLKLFLLISIFTIMGRAQVCNPISTLDCADIEETLPVSLDFTSSGGNISDSGFTMVLEPSFRLSSDDAIADPNVPGYAPSLVSRTDGVGLSIISTKGILFRTPPGTGLPASSNTNSQMNALGVGIDAPAQVFDITLVLDNPDFSVSTGNSSQQAGLYFGLDEDHYAKLVLVKTGTNSRKVQLQVEDLTAETVIELNTLNIASNTGEVTLRMELDPVNNEVRGYYTLGTGAEILVEEGGASSIATPASFYSGVTYDGGTATASFAGIFTSHRNAAVDQSFTTTFKSFSIEQAVTPPPAGFNFIEDFDT